MVNRGNLIAQAQIVIGPLRIYGYQIYKSSYSDGIFIEPPKFLKKDGKYLHLVRFEDLQLWKDIEQKIKDSYHETKCNRGDLTDEELNEISEAIG